MDKVGKQNAKDLAIRHPNVYIALRPLHEKRNKMRKVAPKVVERVLPGYRQKKTTAKLIEDLERTQKELEEKIKKLESVIEKEQK